MQKHSQNGLPWFTDPPAKALGHNTLWGDIQFGLMVLLMFGGAIFLCLPPLISLPFLGDWNFRSTKDILEAIVLAPFWLALVMLMGLLPAGFALSERPRSRLILLMASPVYGTNRLGVSFTLIAMLLISGALLFGLDLYALRRWPPSTFSRENVVTVPDLIYFLYFAIVYLTLSIHQIVSSIRAHRATPLLNLVIGMKSPETILLTHWSDLHITATDTDERTESGPNANRPFREVIRCFREAAMACDVVLVSGDITDAGRAGEWLTFFRAINAFGEGWIRSKLVLVPGNHDLNIYDPLIRKKSATLDRLERKIRQIRFLYAVQRVQAQRSFILSKTGELQRFDEYFATVQDGLERFRIYPPNSTFSGGIAHEMPIETTPNHIKDLIALPQKVWDQVFPIVVEVTGSNGTLLRIITLDSNANSSNVVTNAFGLLHEEQLARVRIIVDICRRERVPFIFSMHHHLGRPSHIRERSWGSRLTERFLSVENAQRFFDAIEHTEETVLFHGHRHLGFSGSLQLKNGLIHIVAAPSTTLGDAGLCSKHDEVDVGFYQYSLSRSGMKVWIGDVRKAATTGPIVDGTHL